MITEACASCRFWKQLDPDGDSADADGGYEVTEFGTGLCRRMPPASRRAELESSLNSMYAARTAFWPVTWDDDRCGEHRLILTAGNPTPEHLPAPSLLVPMASLQTALNDFLPGIWSVEFALDVLATDVAVDEIDEQASALKASAVAVPRDWLEHRLATLWTTFMVGRPVQNDAMMAWLTETARLLDDVPWDIAAFAIDGAVKAAARGFLPSIGEIRVIADPLMAARGVHLERAEVIAKALADDSMRTDRDARAAAAARDRAFRPEMEIH